MAPNEELTNQLEEALRQVNAILFKRGRSILMDMEISALQFNALLTIRDLGPLTMGELCKNLFVACSTATDLADRMEQSELAERTRDGKDRRVVKLRLLAKGKEVLEAVIAERQSLIREVLRDNPDGEYDELLKGLKLLVQRMELK